MCPAVGLIDLGGREHHIQRHRGHQHAATIHEAGVGFPRGHPHRSGVVENGAQLLRRGNAHVRIAIASAGNDGRLARVEQGGWTIDYAGWQPQAGFGIELPQRLTATRDDAKVRLVIDSWQQGTSSP